MYRVCVLHKAFVIEACNLRTRAHPNEMAASAVRGLRHRLHPVLVMTHRNSELA
jgi:hypothetical protein